MHAGACDDRRIDALVLILSLRSRTDRRFGFWQQAAPRYTRHQRSRVSHLIEKTTGSPFSVQPSGSLAHDLPLPARNFAATRRILLIVFAASVLVPFACLCGYGYMDFQRRVVDANDIIDRLSRVADEQAVKVMDLNEAIGSRIIDVLGTSDDREIRGREAALHTQMNDIGGGYPQVAAISVLGADGDLLASSRFYPAPKVSVSQREDFLQARESRPEPQFSLPLRGRLTGLIVFNTSMGRTAVNGDFMGAVMIALRQDYFTSFYSDLTSNNDALLIGLFRDDGGILARYPQVAPGPVPKGNTPFGNALRSGARSGHLRVVSVVDGVERYMAYRRVGNYPLYVAVGYARSAIFAQWWPHLMVVAGLTALRKPLCRTSDMFAATTISKLLKSCATFATRLPSAPMRCKCRLAASADRRRPTSDCHRSHARCSSRRRRSENTISSQTTTQGNAVNPATTIRCGHHCANIAERA
jgi:hypothetical protein